MDDLIQFVARNGYLVVFFGVFIEQIGVPFPSNFLLIVAGALAGMGQNEFSIVILLTVLAATLGDTIWFYIGRSRGFQVLAFLCKMSLEPGYCVSSAKKMFTRHGAKSLLVAKFVPGFSTFAQPLAGATGMSLPRFLVFDALGSLIWVSVFVGLGYVFSNQLESVVDYASRFGWYFGALLILGLAGYIGRKILIRRRFMRDLSVARISPGELKYRIDAKEDIMIVDLRDSMDFEANPVLIPTSLRILPDDLEDRHEELYRDRDIVLFCT
jgi:membrane protein DedA with SNARE-associated domain